MSLHFIVDGKGFTLHYLCVVGSVAHGLKGKNSDLDLKGVISWDLSVTSGIDKIKDSVEKGNVSKASWNDFLIELKEKLNLKFEIDDDITFMDPRKFIVTAKKNELNMLDMLYAKDILYSSEIFKKEVLEKINFLISYKYARSRFKGLSNGSLENYRKNIERFSENNLEFDRLKAFKELARSIHILYLLEEYLTSLKYSSLLKDKSRLKYILDIRSQKITLEEVLVEKEKLFEIIENIPLADKNVDSEECNNMVIKLILSQLYTLVK